MDDILLKRQKRNIAQALQKKIFSPSTTEDEEFDDILSRLSETEQQEIRNELAHRFKNDVVDLCNNNIRNKAAAAVGSCLSTSHCRKINLSHNKIRDEDIPLIFNNDTLNNHFLEEIDLSNNRISTVGATKLSIIIKQTKSLKKVYLDTNAITGSGIEAIARSLCKNKTVTLLSCNWNNLKIFAEEFFFTLNVNRTLQVLRLGYCNIGNEVAEALADGLMQNNTLKELFLVGNLIDDDGAHFLTNSLYKNKSLQYLNLDSNLITNLGAIKILECVFFRHRQKHPNVFVNLEHNGLSKEIESQLIHLRDSFNRKTTVLSNERISIDSQFTDTENYDDDVSVVDTSKIEEKKHRATEAEEDVKLSSDFKALSVMGSRKVIMRRKVSSVSAGTGVEDVPDGSDDGDY